MGKSPQAKADRIEGAEQGFPHRVDSGALTAVNGTVTFDFVAPFDGYVSAFDLNVLTAFNNTTSSVHMGTQANPDSMLDDKDIEDNAAGYQELIGDAAWVSKTVTKGEAYSVGFTAAGTTGVGVIGVTLTPGPGPLA